MNILLDQHHLWLNLASINLKKNSELKTRTRRAVPSNRSNLKFFNPDSEEWKVYFEGKKGGKLHSQGPFVSGGQQARAARSWFLTWTLKFYGAWTKYIGESKWNGVDLAVRADITDSLTDSWITGCRESHWMKLAQEDFHPRGEGLSRDDEESERGSVALDHRKKKKRDFCFKLSSFYSKFRAL